MLKKTIVSAASVILLGLTTAQPIPAQAAVSTTSVAATISDDGLSLSAVHIRFAETLSTSYRMNISAQEIVHLKVEYNLGYREIGMIYTAAATTHKSPDKIIELREQNMGWGEIAKLYGVKVADLKKRNYEVIEKSGIVVYDEPEDYDYVKVTKHDKDEKNDNHPGNGKGHGKGQDHK